MSKVVNAYSGITIVRKDVKVKKLKTLPLGLIPRRIHLYRRMTDIKQAMERYVEAGKEIPQEWIEEYNELID